MLSLPGARGSSISQQIQWFAVSAYGSFRGVSEGWCIYMLACADGTLYTGATNNLTRRVKQHQAGKGARYTRARLPVELVFSAKAKDRSDALKREAALKKQSRKEKLKRLSKKFRQRIPSRKKIR